MKLREENKRLRAALERIIESSKRVQSGQPDTAWHALGRIQAEAGIALGLPLDELFPAAPGSGATSFTSQEPSEKRGT